MTRLSELPTPALVLDLEALKANIRRMADRSRNLGVALRPHVKTHKCVEIARLQQQSGCRGFTVSTLGEARALADHGFDDLTWAFPVIVSRIPEARELAERVRLGLVVDSPPALDALESERFPFEVWLKVDCGYHRAGVDPESPLAESLARRLAGSATVRFKGLLTHSGHAYKAMSNAELRTVAEQERCVMADLADRLRQRGVEVPAVSIGSTPAMSVAESLEGIDEARPGNYVFYDLTQVALGACGIEDCALSVLASVISSQPGATHCVVDAGALALSHDPGPPSDRKPTYGEVFEESSTGRIGTDVRVVSLSQEHGVLSAPRPVARRVRILPNHSCLTAACFDEYAVVRGQEVVDRWKIWRRR